MRVADLIDVGILEGHLASGHVRVQRHPSEPLAILNYTQRCQYDRAWDAVTRQCRGLIFRHGDDRFNPYGEVVARPWPKFHNYGEHARVIVDGDEVGVAFGDKGFREMEYGQPLDVLELEAAVEVTDKLDGSLGILYPEGDGFAVATRGSFTSEQALWATSWLRERHPGFRPVPGFTYLFEILYAANRIVVDYSGREELVLLGAVSVESGIVAGPRDVLLWPGARAERFKARSLAAALALPSRPNAEGIVVRFIESDLMVKIKQDDYVALHRIMTGTNARNVWEWAAVRACREVIVEPKHWGSYLGIDPARAAELLEVGDGWLDGVPDEFHAWVRGVLGAVDEKVKTLVGSAAALALKIELEPDRRKRWEVARDHPACKGILRLAEALANPSPLLVVGDPVVPDPRREEASRTIAFACWREACPAPTSPFARSEDVA